VYYILTEKGSDDGVGKETQVLFCMVNLVIFTFYELVGWGIPIVAPCLCGFTKYKQGKFP